MNTPSKKKPLLQKPKNKQPYLTQKEKVSYKNQILTDLFNSGIIQNKIEGMFFKQNIKLESDLLHDFLNQTFEELSRKEPAYIIEIWERNPYKLVGLAVTILKLRGFTPSHGKDYLPKSCWKQHFLFTSNLNKLQYYNSGEDYEETSSQSYHEGYILSQDTNPAIEVFEDIKEHLTINQKELLEMYFLLLAKKKPDMVDLQRLECYKPLVKKLKTIIKTNHLWN